MDDQAATLRNLVEERTAEENESRTIGELEFGVEENTRVIAITSGKGGVGKTNLAVNLAVGLQMSGKKVMLIDADIGMANVNVLMGKVTNRSLIDLLEDGVELEDVVEEGACGVKYISGVAGIEATLGVNRSAQRKLHRKLGRCSETADTIIIDTGAGLSRHVIEFVLAAEEVLLITTPEPTSLADAYAVIKAYTQYTDKRNIRLIVNRIGDEEESLDANEKLNRTTEKFLNTKVSYLGYVYEDRVVRDAVKKQEPFILMNPDAPASLCVKEIVKSLLTGSEMVSVSKGWRGFLDKLFGY